MKNEIRHSPYLVSCGNAIALILRLNSKTDYTFSHLRYWFQAHVRCKLMFHQATQIIFP